MQFARACRVELFLFLLSLPLALSPGCDCAGPLRPPRDAGPDTNDSALNDVGQDAARDAGPLPCDRDLDCPAGELCFAGFCQPDPCTTMSPCADTERCRAICVALRDPCEGVHCNADETCIDGTCFAGCLPVACEGVTCIDGWFCNPLNGRCEAVRPCNAICGDDRACHLTCTPHSACEGVQCPEGQFCRAGVCQANPCFDVHCASGEVCNDGRCVPTCGCSPECGAPERCVDNHCQCVRHCPPGVTCGEPDGCGGFCSGTCAGAFDVCNQDTGQCQCYPACSPSAHCGDPDGCGGLCPGSCEGSLLCVSGTCTCTDQCADPQTVACGVDLPPTCMDPHPCTGHGTRCTSGMDCDAMGACCPRCPDAAHIPCGTTLPPLEDAAGHVCRTCTDVGTMCASGTSCVNPPGTTMPTERECCAECASASTVMCGARVPDVLDASGHVCRTCSGFGTSGCATDMTCTGGSTGICCPPCDAASSVACGAPIPSTSCRTCVGVGSMCPPGESCVTPPGTSMPTDRECCGNCPSASTVQCGLAVPDQHASDGSVCRDCGLGTMCPSGSTCTDGVCCPQCPPPSSAPCGVAIPDQHDATGRVCRTCGTGNLCAAGSTCAGGSCCPTCPNPSSLACGTDPPEGAGCPMCPIGTMCPSGQRCGPTGCCAPTCTPASMRACGDTPSDGCGSTCAPGTMCASGETCMGSPLHCVCTPSCVGRRCGESDGCGGQCLGSCDPGFQCSERQPPTMPRQYDCVPSQCVPSCGLCESCVLNACEPMTCAPGSTPCDLSCDCCNPGEVCTVAGCSILG